jgi:copper(I)-binding protein
VNHIRSRFVLAPLAASALVLSLAACGSDDDTGSAATTADTATATTMASVDTSVEMPVDTAAEMPDDVTDDTVSVMVSVGDITVSGPWVREPAEGQTRSAVYATITNDGDADVTLVSASVPFEATVEIHETIIGDDGAMSMQEVPEGFVVPAGGSFTLEPGGPHIMLIDIDPADIVGEIEVTLVFDDGTEVTVPAAVRTVDMSGMESGMTETTMSGG